MRLHATRRLVIAVSMLLVVGGTACAQPNEDAGCGEVDVCEVDRVGRARGALSLEALAGTGGCSTAGGEALSAQLIGEMLCLSEGRLVPFEHANVTLTSSRVHPYLSPEGRDALYRAADSGEIRINSGLRTISDQYLLYAGCAVAATPGRSNHETGRAIDVQNWSARLSALVAAGFTHPLPDSDAVHFEAPGDDLRDLSVRAFQRLWNANHPTDTIATDGVSGPETLARLARAPAEGFAIAGVCSAAVPDAGLPDAGAPDLAIAGDADASDAAFEDGRPRVVPDAGCGCSNAGTDRGGSRARLALALAAMGFAWRRRSRRRPR
jgi:MYXO-CTERM domain-containing protein